MSLKFMLENLEGLDDSVAGLYQKHDDEKFYLDVDGAVSKDRLDEFRNNNVKLMKKLEAFEGIDPKKYKSLEKFQADFKDKKAITDDDIENIVSDRVKTMQEEFNTKLSTAAEKESTLNRQLEGLLIDSAVRKAATTAKVLDTAVDDVLLRAKSTFKVVDGVATPYDDKGNVVYGRDGANPMQIDEWMNKLSTDAGHLFVQSSGGGSRGAGGAAGKVDAANLTPLQKIQQGLSD